MPEHPEQTGMNFHDDHHAPIETWQARISGRVQGVGYRETCVSWARALGVTGWVRNRSDGTVEALLQGPREQLLQLQSRLRRGPPDARVDELLITELDPSGERFDRFERRPTE